MSGKWSWNPATARRVNGCANPVDREPGIRDTDGRLVPEWRRRAVLPPDCRRPMEDTDSPLLHAESFSAARMWAGYFAGHEDPARCEAVDKCVRDGKCVALGAVAGVYTVEQILFQAGFKAQKTGG